MHRMMIRALCSLCATAALVCLTRPALAQRAPDFATLDRQDGITRVALDLGSTFLSGPPGTPDAALRFDLWGQYVFRSGLGIYGALPLGHTIGDGDDQTALGDLELGLHYVVDRPTWSLVLRGGLGLPTADSDFAPNALGVFPRLTDFALVVPDALYARFSLSPLWHADRWFTRIDAGIDAPLAEDEDTFDADPLIRLNLAGGYDAGAVAVMAEVVTLADVNDFAGGETFESTAALTLRYMGDILEPYLAVGLPLDSSSRDVADVFVAAGIQIMLH